VDFAYRRFLVHPIARICNKFSVRIARLEGVEVSNAKAHLLYQNRFAENSPGNSDLLTKPLFKATEAKKGFEEIIEIVKTGWYEKVKPLFINPDENYKPKNK
jgi:hypothetical protein